jgi:hypothetical protein
VVLKPDLRPANWRGPSNWDKLSEHDEEDEVLAVSKPDHCPTVIAHNREESWAA